MREFNRELGYINLESDEYIEDLELPPYLMFKEYMEDYSQSLAIVDKFRFLLDLDWKPWKKFWSDYKIVESKISRMLKEGYDYQNLYDSLCDTAVYYFIETIDLDFDDMDEDSEYYPFGYFSIHEYLEKRGIKLPSYGDRGKYGKSMLWE